MVKIEYDGQYHCCHCQKPLKKRMPYAKSGYCSWECQVKDNMNPSLDYGQHDIGYM